MPWCDGLAEICRPDVPLGPYTWYGLGGPARWLVEPRDEAELVDVLRRLANAEVPWRILGHGANLLVRDAGVAAAVIRLTGPAWDWVRYAPPGVHAGGGADFPKLVKHACERGLVGLENLAGIPGTLGGIVRQNAGGKYGSISQYAREVRLALPTGELVTRRAEELHFAYRHTDLGGGIVVAATLALVPGNGEEVMQRFRQIWSEKHASQPAVAQKSCGCIFKNPPGQAAGRLIDEAGLKGTRRGGAEISPRHANFIVAGPGASAANVLDLIELARERVRARTGIELELEVEIW